ncbi:metallophosphoesterase family protein [Roseomonas fluvialis]|uniref:Phosphodiesterase n=1 Tax=Roseomonas fluvialis TaxID=1750527 RepID=A0ABN6P7Q2_9PROT|nr:metallophosphoesterase [Roseomonas fluvialis]BDG74814.1 phosphodiesterase [Roseomonas fluvialis]
MIRIAHLSDLHFGAHIPGLVEPLLADIARFAPDAIAISGDLTQRAQPEEFAQAAAFLAALPAPCVAVPGNHDIPGGAVLERLADPRRRWRRFIGAETEPMLLLPGAALVGLDTVRRVQPRLDWSAGGVSSRRRARLAARLAACAGRSIVVVAHHPLRHPAAIPGRSAPIGGEAALAMLADAGVAAVLSGHLHRPGRIPGPPEIVLTGSSLSHRTRGLPNSWTLVELDGGALRVNAREDSGDGWRAA